MAAVAAGLGTVRGRLHCTLKDNQQGTLGLLRALAPWPGMDAHGAEVGVIATRPWAAPEHQELVKNSRHLTVVQPLRYDNAQPINWFRIGAGVNFGVPQGSTASAFARRLQ